MEFYSKVQARLRAWHPRVIPAAFFSGWTWSLLAESMRKTRTEVISVPLASAYANCTSRCMTGGTSELIAYEQETSA